MTESTAPRRRTQQERRAHTRAELLRAVTTIVAEGGWAAATGARVAAAAGVTRGALQHHFPERLDLPAALVAAGWDALADRYRAEARRADDPLPDRAQRWAAALLGAYAAPEPRAAYEVIAALRGDPAWAAHAGPVLRQAEAELDALWNTAFADTPASPDERSAARLFARDQALGGIVQRIAGGDPAAVHRVDAADASRLGRVLVVLLGATPPAE